MDRAPACGEWRFPTAAFCERFRSPDSRKSRDGRLLRLGVVLPPGCVTHRRTGDSTMSQFRKTVCPVSRQQFVAEAKAVEVSINGQTVLAEVKEFSTGSFGW